MCFRIAALLFLLHLPLQAQAQTGPWPDSDPAGGLQWSVSVRRVHRPILIQARGGKGNDETACNDLGTDQITVLEDGERVPVTAIGPRPQARIHALLIDTSGSMRARLGEAKAAATAYIEALPPDDVALVASFDDSMVLSSPVMSSRQPALNAVEQLRAGTFTALWDSLYEIIDYLSTLDGEKVVILISDGGDTTQLTPDAYQTALDMITGTPDLLVFPIGINLSNAAQVNGVVLSDRLRELATRTGGELFRLRSIRSLSDILQQIHERLDARQYVSYVPQPFGDGPRDRPDLNDHRWRKVKVRTEPGTGCKITSLDHALRLEHRDNDFDTRLQSAPASDADASRLATALGQTCSSGGPDFEIADKLRFSPPSYGTDGLRDPVYFYTTVSGDRVIGETMDVVVERGLLFRSKSYWGAGKIRLESDRQPILAQRTIVVETPPIEVVQGELTGPVELVTYMLKHRLCAPVPDVDRPHVRAPVFVYGRTFLDTRDHLGRVLLRDYPDYRKWATSTVEASIDSTLADLVQGVPGLRDLSDSDAAALRQALLLRETDPENGRMRQYLTEWLGDVSALETVRALERTTMNRVLSGEAVTDPEAAARIELVESSWPRLALWFGPATSVRVITPMIPSYDIDRDIIGFYRFVLPWPRPGVKVELVLDRPLGLLTMRWLFDRPGVAGLLGGQAEVVSLKAEPTKRKKTRGLTCPGPVRTGTGSGQPILRNRVAFELRRIGSDTERIGVEAYFYARAETPAGVDPNHPVCFDVSRRGQESPWSADVVHRLLDLLARPEALAARDERDRE